MKIIDSISDTEIKNILIKQGIEWRNSKIVMDKSKDPEYELKKVGLNRYDTIHLLQIRIVISKWKISDSSKKIYNGTSWCSIQS